MKARALLPLSLMLISLGCGKGSYTAVPVSGQVTMNNQPLANVIVSFQPVGTGSNPNPGPGSSGKTDSEGRFTLKLLSTPPRDGAVVGQHRVQIYTPETGEGAVPYDPELGSPDGAPAKPSKPVEFIPARYHDQSKMTFDVPEGGTNQANFALTRP